VIDHIKNSFCRAKGRAALSAGPSLKCLNLQALERKGKKNRGRTVLKEETTDGKKKKYALLGRLRVHVRGVCFNEGLAERGGKKNRHTIAALFRTSSRDPGKNLVISSLAHLTLKKKKKKKEVPRDPARRLHSKVKEQPFLPGTEGSAA